MIYLSLIGVMGLLRLLLTGMDSLRRELYPILLFLLFVFSAFRLEVGCDWTGYINQFDLYRYATLEDALQNLEPLWVGLFILQHWLELPYPWINVFSSFIFFAGVHVLARRQPDPLAFLILLFPVLIVNMPMSGIRQGAAIGMMCAAFAAFIDRSWLRFVALTLLASGLHSSAIIFLLLTPLVTGRYSRQRVALAAALAVPGALVLFSGDAVEQAASRYIDTGVDAFGALFRSCLLLLTALFYFAFLRKKWSGMFPEEYKLIDMGALGMAGVILLLPISSVIADRLGYYLIPIQAAIFARIPYFQIRKNHDLLSVAPYLGLAVFFAVWMMLSFHFQKCYLPYDSWFLSFMLGEF